MAYYMETATLTFWTTFEKFGLLLLQHLGSDNDYGQVLTTNCQHEMGIFQILMASISV